MKKFIKKFLNLWSVLLTLVLVLSATTYAATQYPAGSLLQPNDVTTTHIRDYTILDADINSSAAIEPSKIKGGSNSKAIFFDNGSRVGTSSNLTYVALTTGLTNVGTTTLTGTTTISGVSYAWPSADGSVNYKLQTNGAGQLSWAPASNIVLSQTFTAGETLSTGAAIALGDGAQTTVSAGTVNSQLTPVMNGANYGAYKFTTPASNFAALVSFTVSFHNTNGSSLFVAPLYTIVNDNAGSPGGTVYGSVTAGSTNVSGSADANITGTFATPVILSANTTYWITINDTLFQGGGLFEINRLTTNTNGDKKTANTGSSWSAAGADLVTGYVYAQNATGRAYLASAATSNFRSKGFVGLATGAAAAGGTITVDMLGLSLSTSTPSVDTTYYLNDTNGTLGTSAGSVSRVIGLGLGSAGFLLRPSNP